MVKVLDWQKNLIAPLILGVIFVFSLTLYFEISALISLLILTVFFIFILFLLKPDLGLVLMAFFLPVIHWEFFYKNLAIPFIDLLGMLVLAAFFCRVFASRLLSAGDEYEKIKWPVFLPFSLFFLAVMISGYFAKDNFASWWYGVRWVLFFYLVYVFLPFNIIKDQQVLKKVLTAFFLSALAAAVIGIISFYGQDWRYNFVRAKPISIAGIFPIGSNQNLLAEVLLPGVFFTLALREFISSVFLRKVLNLSALIITIVLVLTFSRAGWLGLLIGAAFYLLVFYKKEMKKIIAPALAVIVLSLPAIIYMYNLQKEYKIGGSSNENRILLTQIAWQAFFDKPVFGQGSGQFLNLVENNIRFKNKYGPAIDSHGVWQKIAAENGLFGLATFSFLILSCAGIIYKAAKESRGRLKYFLLISASALSIFIFEFFNTSYYKGKMWLPIAVCLAAAEIIKKGKMSNRLKRQLR